MAIGTGRVRPGGVALRRLPDATSEVLYRDDARSEVTLVRVRWVNDVPWVRLRLPDGREGWTRQGEGFDAFHTAQIEGDAAPIRSAPAESAPVIARLRRGISVTVLLTPADPPSEWVRARTKTGREGFLHESTPVCWDLGAEPSKGPPELPRVARVPGFHVVIALNVVVHRLVRLFGGLLSRRTEERRNAGIIGLLPDPRAR